MMKKTFFGLGALLLIASGWLFSVGYARTTPYGWYPFITSFFADFYTAGPFGMTSNTREDNPIWLEIPAINKALARLTYAMTRGEPQADIAWLLPTPEWIDKPALGEGLNPNRHESRLSREITNAGLVYDRISRSDLERAQASNREIVVGAMRYKALVIQDLPAASPKLLQKIQALASQGVPILWLGELPSRAIGWSKTTQNDVDIKNLCTELTRQIALVPNAAGVVSELAHLGVTSPLLDANRSIAGLRTQRRTVGNGTLILLFNDSERTLNLPITSVLRPNRNQPLDLLNPEDGSTVALNDASVSIPARRARILKIGDTNSLWDFSIWENPAREFRPYIRWWWPGNAVEPQELRRELQSLHEAGFGGVELQTLTLGIPHDKLRQAEQQIYQVGTPRYFANLKTVFALAQELGMAVDLTFGSGWPSGGPFIDRYPEQQLIATTLDVRGSKQIETKLPDPQEPFYVKPTNWIIANTIGAFDSEAKFEAVVAARLDTSTAPDSLHDFIDLSRHYDEAVLRWQVPSGTWRIFAFYRNRTQHNLVASAFPQARSQSRVLDHLDPGGIQEYISEFGEPWLQALAPYKPQAFFVDSFELIAELPWSAPFRQAFFEQHGYDLTPYLPLVLRANGESKYLDMVLPTRAAYQSANEMGLRIREDYEATREKLFRESFLIPLKEWSSAQGIQLRLQAHGGYGDYLDSYQLADIPESEGLFAAGNFEFLKLAASAGHVAGRNQISSESFVVMLLDVNALSADDYYYLAGNAYAAGINRLMYHGHAYRWEMTAK